MSGQKRHKIFIAINLPQDIKKSLANYDKKWRELPARWVSAENLHITLVFLGDLTDKELGEVCMMVKEVVKKHNSFDINLNNISYGPDNKKDYAPLSGANGTFSVPPRMVWANGEKSKELSLLKKDLQNSLLEKINFKPENKTFSPHITLARISTFLWRQIEPEERPQINENIDMIFTVESIEVMSSETRSRFKGARELRRGGPQYIIIESHQLQ